MEITRRMMNPLVSLYRSLARSLFPLPTRSRQGEDRALSACQPDANKDKFLKQLNAMLSGGGRR